MSRARGVLFTLLIAMALLARPGSGWAASDERLGIQLLEAPVSSRQDPRALIYIVDGVPAGTTIQRDIRVSNFADDPADVDLYPGAAGVGGGEFRFGRDRSSNELSSWITLTRDRARIPGRSVLDVTVTVTVPAGVEDGERYAVIWAERASDPETGQVQEINRVGIRVYLDVAGALRPSSFDIEQVSGSRGEDGAPTVSATVRNTGERAVDVSGQVTLADGPAGLSAAPMPVVDVATLAPGEQGQVLATFDPELPAGPWTVTVALVSGTVHTDATAVITFPDVAAVPVTVSIDHGGGLWRWWLVGSGVLAVLVLAAAASVRGRRSATGPL